MKVIIADDSKVIRTIIDRAITAMNLETLHAANGQELLDILARNRNNVSLVLLDWNMPVMSGIDALKKMHETAEYKDIPVLMISTESERARISEAIDAGAKGYLPKPFTAEELHQAISGVIKKMSK